MKRIISMLLSLLMLFSLCGVVSAYAFGSESAGDVTVLFTGGVGTAVGGEGLSYACAAALKGSYDKDEVLLVDAGGFNAGAADIMAAAGYDLAVPEKELEEWSVASISMGVEELKAGAMLEKNGTKVAFVGIVPMGEEKAEDYYAAIQKSVNAAAAKADFVIALGAVEEPKALAENVSSLTAVLTYGETTEDIATVETESGDGTATTTTILCVGEAFDAIGALKLSKAAITAEIIDSETFADKDLTADADVAALEADFEAVEDSAGSENNENTDNGDDTEDGNSAGNDDNTDNSDNTDNDNTDNSDNNENGGNDSVETNSNAAQNTDADAANAATNGDEDEEDKIDASPTDTDDNDDDNVSTDLPVETTNASSTNTGTESVIVEWDRTKGQDLSITLPGEVSSVDVKDNGAYKEYETDYYALSADKKTVTFYLSVVASWGETSFAFRFNLADNTTVEKTLKMVGTAPVTTTTPPTAADYAWKAGDGDLAITLDKAVSSIKVGNKDLENKYYTLSSDNKTVTVKADMLSGWKNGTYGFEFTFTDNTTVEKKVSVSGNAETTTTPTATPSPTPTPGGKNPATGDESPIGLYIGIFVVLLVVLIVAIVLVVRKGKKR